MFLTELGVSRALYYICGVSSLKAQFHSLATLTRGVSLSTSLTSRSSAGFAHEKHVFSSLVSLASRLHSLRSERADFHLKPIKRADFPLGPL